MGWSDEKEPLKYGCIYSRFLKNNEAIRINIMVNYIHTITRVVAGVQTIHYGKMIRDR